jgi:hypothetical protein
MIIKAPINIIMAATYEEMKKEIFDQAKIKTFQKCVFGEKCNHLVCLEAYVMLQMRQMIKEYSGDPKMIMLYENERNALFDALNEF